MQTNKNNLEHNSNVMEAVEMIIFLLFAIIAGGLIILFLNSVNFWEIQDNLFQTFVPSREISDFKEVNYLGLLDAIDICWNSCRFGDLNVDCGIVFLNDERLADDEKQSGLSEEFFKEKVTRFNFCQSCEFSLNNIIIPPTLVDLKCEEGKVKLIT